MRTPLFKRGLVLSVLVLCALGAKPQTDTEFWFVVPEIAYSHNPPGGIPASFRFTTGELATTITISMPLNSAEFPERVIHLPPNTFHVEDVSCMIVGCPPLPLADRNVMENKPLNPSGINPFGVRITSTAPITAYYEVSNANNRDIWSLKGRNALGTEFFTPFQTNRENNAVAGTHGSSIDVVATRDGTQVTFRLPPGIGASFGSPMTHIAAGSTYTVTLNRGQTFSLFPLNGSLTAANRLRGVRITSTLPIAVTLKDDSFFHTAGGCFDVAGDQLIPVWVPSLADPAVPDTLIGREYAVIRTSLAAGASHDHIYILATQNNTVITIRHPDGSIPANTIGAGGVSQPNPTTLNAQQQLYVRLPTPHAYFRVSATRPVYVWHVGGFGCEQGGAILPPIDRCTGSNQVAFSRTDGTPFFILLMARQGAEDGFRFLVNGVDRSGLIPAPASFHAIPGLPWSVRLIGPLAPADVPVGVPLMMTNREDVFHLGIINGNATTGAFYGYFSDFNTVQVNAALVGTAATAALLCHGDAVQLWAVGGTRFRWYEGINFLPPTTLNNDTIQSPLANPIGNTVYHVVVSGACGMTDTTTIDIQSSSPINALFTLDSVQGCAPFTVRITNHSTFGTPWARYYWDFGDGTTRTNLSSAQPNVFTHTFTNNTNSIIERTIRLELRNSDDCYRVYTKRVAVRPSITASYTQTLIGDPCQNPREVQFTNTSSSNTANTYLWTFGDGLSRVSTSATETFTHRFENRAPSDTTYTVTLTAISPFGCRSTHTTTVDVTSAFEPAFTLGHSAGCSPLELLVSNHSTGDARTFLWEASRPIPPPGLPTGSANFTPTLTNTTADTLHYRFRLRVTNSHGCSKTTPWRTVVVFPGVAPAFTAPASVCNNTPVLFTNTTTSPATSPASIYSWTFGDGAGSIQPSPTHTYMNTATSAPGNYIARTYPVTLRLTNPWGCRDSVTRTITVAPLVLADFALTPGEGCSPLRIDIANNSMGNSADTYRWDFGDGSPISTSASVTQHTYVNNGVAPLSRNLQLIRRNAQGCADTLTRTVTIYPRVNLSITPTTATICDSAMVSFSATLAPLLPNMNFSWNFGDGSASSPMQSPTHQYRNLGDANSTHTATLVATSQYACRDTATATITVNPRIRALLNVGKSALCHAEPLTITYGTMPGITGYAFTFPGYTDNVWPGHAAAQGAFTKAFNNIGAAPLPVTVRLTVNNANPQCVQTHELPITIYPRVTAAFTPSTTVGCNPLTVSFTNTSAGVLGGTYHWDLGDGSNTNTFAPPSQVYSHPHKDQHRDYTVRLTATNPIGCSHSTTQTIRVLPLVVADFIVDEPRGCSPWSVTPRNVSTSPAYVYTWSFGNGDPNSTLEQPGARTYVNNLSPMAVFTPTITLTTGLNTAVHGQSCAKTLSVPLAIYPRIQPNFTANLQGCHPHTVTFTNTTNAYGGIGNALYQWTLGTGLTTTSTHVTQTYQNTSFSQNATFPVRLRGISVHGCTDSVSANVTVFPTPQAKLQLPGEYLRCSPFEAELQNHSLAPAGTVFAFDLGFPGPGSTVTRTNLQPVTHSFVNSNSTTEPYVLTLTATTPQGCTDTDRQTIHVYPHVTAQFHFNPGPAACNPFTPTMVNTSTGAWYYSWDFDDGFTSNLHTPTHRFVNSAPTVSHFDVRLTARSEFDCVDTLTRQLTVYPAPVAAFMAAPPLKVYPDATFDLINQTQPADPSWSWLWDFGDGHGSNQMHPGRHTYQHWGDRDNEFRYYITLMVSNAYCTDTVTQAITLRPANPIALFTSVNEIYSGCSPLDVYFRNHSLHGDRFHWEFGDGTTSDDFEPRKEFTEPGYYFVRLRVSGDGGEQHYYRTFQVYPNPVARFTAAPPRVLLPDAEVRFYSQSEHAEQFLWDMGDGTIYTDRNPVHTYRELGQYGVRLTVWSEHGCEHSYYDFPAVWVEGQGRIEFPNAFVPSTAGPSGGFYDEVSFRNEVFHPVAQGVAQYRLFIYNRWGERIFESRDVRVGWDGYFNGVLSPQDVYVWRATGKFTNGEVFDKRGNVTLLR